MRFVPQTAILTTDGALRYLFAWLDFMRTASPSGPGWSIPRSSNGSTGGAGDNIAAFGDLSQYAAGTSESWFVLRTPDAASELLFFRTSASDLTWSCSRSPGALFVGGDAGNPPTATDSAVFMGASAIVSQIDSVLHMGADDAAPYGFFTYMHANGNFADARASMAFVPITAAQQPGDVDPYVFVVGVTTTSGFLLAELTEESATATQARISGIIPGQAAARTCPALTLRSEAGNMFPNDAPADDNSNDLSMPMSFGVRSPLSAPSGFKGISDFMQWNGVQRAPGETFATRTRVSWGDVNFPWDGSVPLDT